MNNNNKFFEKPFNKLNKLNENSRLNKNKNYNDFYKELNNIDYMSLREKDDFFNKYIVQKIFKGELSSHQNMVVDSAKMIFYRIINDIRPKYRNINYRVSRIKKLITFMNNASPIKVYDEKAPGNNANNLRKIPSVIPLKK
jgi:hypothetical protein